MQIIIPMSGFGERFRSAGYDVPKPLIKIEGKPIIAHVIDMFPGETNFIFICNEEHLANTAYQMEATLRSYCPTGKIVSIKPHKLGPIYAVCQIESLVNLTEPVIVNYCDFTCYWDWHHFKKWVATLHCMGVVPAYKGFHPHTLGTTNYAYIREKNGWMVDIQEKQPFTNNRMNEYASSGTYYFATGKIMLAAFHAVMAENLHVNNEYYVSLAYKPLLAAHQPIAIYELQHFMQWGTPEDVTEYQYWSRIFHILNQQNNNEYKPLVQGTVVIPMAGLGKRYAQEGYKITKPLIPVSGKPMVVQATDDLPKAEVIVFVLRSDMPEYEKIIQVLQTTYSNAVIEKVAKVTEGQACTALKGVEALADHISVIPSPITFGACDNGVIYDQQKLQQLIEDPKIDVIVWGIRGHPHAICHPEMYGWIDVENDIVKNISVKMPLASPATDPIIIGTFTFKSADDFKRCTERMINRDARINGEFYIDTCINDAIALGLRCELFEVDCFISWGTPNDLKTFEYWQSCFDKWDSHPYTLEQDRHIPADQRKILKNRYQPILPELLKDHA